MLSSPGIESDRAAKHRILHRLIKDSSLISAIGFVELTRSAKLVIARTFQPFTVYLVVALVYFLTCYLLSVVSRKIEWRLQN